MKAMKILQRRRDLSTCTITDCNSNDIKDTFYNLITKSSDIFKSKFPNEIQTFLLGDSTIRFVLKYKYLVQ